MKDVFLFACIIKGCKIQFQERRWEKDVDNREPEVIYLGKLGMCIHAWKQNTSKHIDLLQWHGGKLFWLYNHLIGNLIFYLQIIVCKHQLNFQVNEYQI